MASIYIEGRPEEETQIGEKDSNSLPRLCYMLLFYTSTSCLKDLGRYGHPPSPA